MNKYCLPWFLVFVVCVPTAIIASTPLYGFGEYFFFLACGVCLFRWRGETEYVVVYAAEVTLPIVCIIAFSVATFVYIRKSLRQRHRRASQFSLNVTSVSRQHRARQRALTRVFVALLTVQVVCILPAVGTALIGAAFGGYDQVPNFVFQIDTVLLLSNMAVNPIVQSVFRMEIRTAVCSVFAYLTCRQCQSHSTVLPTRGNHGSQLMMSIGPTLQGGPALSDEKGPANQQ